ncbi:MAG: hypothetical protein J5580_02680 [Clostridia bacterium]|nr:hypothetical protein [Clostridia bacterium]
MEKESIFEFLKECDENIYQEIIDEVEPNMVNNTCLQIIQSKFENIIKNKILEKSGIYLECSRPTMKDILNHNKFKKYLIENDLMSEDDIKKFWVINHAANDYKHGLGKIEITTELKGRALLYLFNLCKNYYRFALGKTTNAEFDIEYVVSLIDGKKEIELPKITQRVSTVDNEIIIALEQLEAKLHNDSGYSVRQILFEMGIETNPDNEKTMRRKLRKLMDKKIYPDISGAGNEDIVYTPGGKGSGTYRLSKYRGK